MQYKITGFIFVFIINVRVNCKIPIIKPPSPPPTKRKPWGALRCKIRSHVGTSSFPKNGRKGSYLNLTLQRELTSCDHQSFITPIISFPNPGNNLSQNKTNQKASWTNKSLVFVIGMLWYFLHTVLNYRILILINLQIKNKISMKSMF